MGRKKRGYVFKVISKIRNLKIKDIEIQGNDDRGYRLVVTEKKPIQIKTKKGLLVFKRGRARITGYFDMTKEELIKFIDNAIKEDYEGIEIEVSYGCSAKELVFIPKKYYSKIINQLQLI